MRRLLTARHVLVSAGSGLAVFVLFTSVIGIAVAQDDSPQEAPTTFVTARPMFGDEVMYELSGLHYVVEGDDISDAHEHQASTEGGLIGPTEPESPSSHGLAVPAEVLQPFGPVEYGFKRDGSLATQRDAAGVVHDVEYVSWGVTSDHAPDNDDAFDPTAHVVETGVPIGRYMSWSEQASATWDSQLDPVIQSESYSLDYQGATFVPADPVPPCILRHIFQDGPQNLTGFVTPFGECALIGTQVTWSGAPMKVIGVETNDGVATLHLRGVSPDLSLDIWLEPQVPYPVRVLTTIGDESIDLRLTDYAAGDKDALAYVDTPRDALPALKDDGIRPSGLSFEGLEHPFPPEQAYQAAYDDPLDSAFREWADANSGHTVLRAFYHEGGYYGGAESQLAPTAYWALEFGTEHGIALLDMERRTIETADGQTQYIYDYEFRAWSDTIETFPMPSIYPSAKALADRWVAYLPDGVTAQPTMYFWDDKLDAWEIRAQVFEEESSVPGVYGVGDYRYHVEDGWAAFDANGTLLGMDYDRFTTEGGTATIVDDAPTPTPNPGTDSEPAAPTALKAAPDAPWVAPTPAQAAGAAGVAVATGALVYLWPVLKGLPFFGLFSRLRRPELLGHPSRKKILDVIEADPGIHFQELLRRTGLTNGNLVHHLRKLGQAGLVSDTRSGGYTCYFASQHADRHTMMAAPALRSEAARTMMAAIKDRPGVCSRDLAEALGIGSSTVHYHLKRLQDAGLAKAQRDGRDMTFFPTESARRMVLAS